MHTETGLSFAEFVERADICRAARYLAYRRVRDALGAKAVSAVGLAAVVAAGGVSNPKQQREVLEEARVWEGTNGTSISDQSARGLVRDIKSRQAAISTQHKSYLTLARENARLCSELSRLKQENEALRAELRKLKSPAKARARGRGKAA